MRLGTSQLSEHLVLHLEFLLKLLRDIAQRKEIATESDLPAGDLGAQGHVLLNGAAEGNLWQERQVCELCASDRTGSMSTAKPLLDSVPLVDVAILRHHWVAHDFMRNRAFE